MKIQKILTQILTQAIHFTKATPAETIQSEYPTLNCRINLRYKSTRKNTFNERNTLTRRARNGANKFNAEM